MNKQNIIFVDTEFNGLDPNKVELLSIGLVKLSGEELYLEIKFEGKLDPWVEENVIPKFKGKNISKEEAIKKIKEFVGNNKPYFVAYVNQFDWIGLLRLFDAKGPKEISEKVPFFWAPVDLSSILFEKGFEPNTNPTKVAEKLEIDYSDIKEHNALDDARLIKRIYEKIKNE